MSYSFGAVIAVKPTTPMIPSLQVALISTDSTIRRGSHATSSPSSTVAVRQFS
jgi:hypothetical protein